MSQERALTTTASADTLILDFLAARSGRSKLLLLVSYPGCGILLQQPERMKTYGLNFSDQDA